MKKLKEILNSVDWDALFSDNNVKQKLAIFEEMLDNADSMFVPRMIRRTRQKQLWWTRGIEQAWKLKQKIWNIYKDKKNRYAYYNCKMALNNATKSNAELKKEVLKKIACNIRNDPIAFYRYAGEKMKTKDSFSPLMNDNGDVIRDSSCVASMLNKYFVSAFAAEYTDNLPLINIFSYRDINVLSHIKLSSYTIYKKLKNLRP